MNRSLGLAFGFGTSLMGGTLLLAAVSGCAPSAGKGDSPTPTPTPVSVLVASSKSSTVAITDDDRFVVMTNPEDASISVFSTADNGLVSKIAVGKEPSAVVIAPDGTTAYVANRADATVMKITGIGVSPSVVATVPVGSEPVGLALAPTGSRLFVAEFAESRVTAIDTASMTVAGSVAVKNPRGIAVTNDSNAVDSDETVVVTEFFGTPIPGAEGQDVDRSGAVRLFHEADLSDAGTITLSHLDSGFAPVAAQPTVQTSPNLLYSAAIQGGKVYVTSESSSPAGPSVFNGNVFPVVYVADLATLSEDHSTAGTTDLAKKVADAIPAGTGTRFFLADLVDQDFIGSSNISYAVSEGADVVQRVVWDTANGVSIGSTLNKQIDIGTPPTGQTDACITPTGIVTANAAARAYVNCRGSRRLGVVDLSQQALVTTVESVAPPTDPAVIQAEQGRHFFFTGRGRWSKESWSSCNSCHPDGLSDGITWIFAAGPRQTISLDGTFSHGGGAQKQRILNWTANFEEIHDFERNTRGTSGGLGAITTSPTNACGNLAAEVQDPATASLPGGLAQPMKELQDRTTNCTKAWDAIEGWIKTVRPPHGLTSLDPASVARGAVLFGSSDATHNNGDCVKCHSGSGFTVSRRFWTPTSATNTSLASATFTRPAAFPATWNNHTLQVENQTAASDNTGAAIAPAEVACVIRNIGTFGVPGDVNATDALEKKPDGTRAQGAGGFNVPPLYGLSVGAPYLHHGQAPTLDALFSDAKWQSHLLAGNPVFLTTGDPAQQKQDLISYLLSIDAASAEPPIPSGFDACPATFP